MKRIVTMAGLGNGWMEGNIYEYIYYIKLFLARDCGFSVCTISNSYMK